MKNNGIIITAKMKKEIEKEVNSHNAFVTKYFDKSNGKSTKADSKFIGNCVDIIVNRPKSKNNGKSNNNEKDCFIAKLKNGKRVYIATESKVNEGHNFTEKTVKENYYIILCKCNNDILYKYITTDKMIEFLLSLNLHYTEFKSFFNTSFCSVHTDKNSKEIKYRILYKTDKYSKYLDTLPLYFNDIVIE